MKNFILYCLLLVLFTAEAQQKDTLAKYDANALLEKAAQRNLNCKIYTEEIVRRNPSSSIKAEALNIIADYYVYNVGDFNAAIQSSKKSLLLSQKANYKKCILDNLSRLSIIYAILNKNDEALHYLSEIKKYNYKEIHETYTSYAVIYYLMGDFEKSISIYNEMITKMEASLKEDTMTEKEAQKTRQLLSETYGDIATIYNFKQLDSASFYIEKAQKVAPDVKNNYNWYTKTFNIILRKNYDEALSFMEKNHEKYIKNNKVDTYQYFYYKAICYQKKGDFQKGFEYAKKAIENKVTIISYVNFELECYKIAAECAQKLGKTEEATIYYKKYSETSQKINYGAKAAFMAKLYEQDAINPLQEELAKKSSSTNNLFWLMGFAVILTGYLTYRTIKSKNEELKFLAIIEKFENNKQETENTDDYAEEISPTIEEQLFLNDFEEESETGSKKNISAETENKILKKLEIFERKKQFLDPHISLGTLALDFKTNTTYITYVIKKHKNDNLINYINKLRIEYIIQKMASQPEYANYKIEYLAQESGFSSYSTFKRIFTKETGIDPSKFITYLKQATEKDSSF